MKVDVSMNATDKNGRPYLVALGSVADTGDVGVVGRGNRINGLITPMRPMSIEAPAGKNPIDHTGKIYGVLAMELAQEIYEYLQWPVTVHIYTEKENRLDDPTEIMIKVSGIEIDAIMQENIEQIITNRIKNVGCNGVQREHNKKLNNGLPILHKVPPKRDYGRYFCILAEKGGTSHGA